MKIDRADEEFDGFPTKYLDIKQYVRMGADGLPQLIRVEPLTNDDGVLLIQNVTVYVDEGPGLIMDRWTASAMVSASSYIPLEKYLNYKHLILH
jgi:hypothetical protein